MNTPSLGRLSRRTSLSALIATGLTGVLARSQAGHAKPSAKKKAKKKCKKQEAQCIVALAPLCEDDPACLAQFQQCCAFTARCDIPSFFTCTQQNN